MNLRTIEQFNVKIFEDLPLYIKMDIIKHHRIILGDDIELSYYFYWFRKDRFDMEIIKGALERIAEFAEVVNTAD